MTDIHRRLSERFRSQWIKVKFYRNKPDFKNAKRLENVKFCEATREAIAHPVILDKDSVSCLGARYALGWDGDYRKNLLNNCGGKERINKNILNLISAQVPHFKKPFKYIGLNTDGEPDIVISYMAPSDVMSVVRIFNSKFGKNLDCSLCGMMSICSGIAAATYLNRQINISFGCDDSRKFADMKREMLAIGIPYGLFKVFAD